MNYKKNSLIFLIAWFISMGLVIAFNYIIDPVGLYRPNGYEYGIAKILLSGKNVADVSDYDERLMNKFYLEKMNYIPETIVLGSSRSLFIEPPEKSKIKFYNVSIHAACLQDLIAMYGIFIKREIKPKTIVICLDPWLLNEHGSYKRWQPLSHEYYDEIARLNIKSTNEKSIMDLYQLVKFKELVSMPYFLASCDKFKKQLNKNETQKSKYYATNSRDLDVAIKRSNGSMSYPLKMRRMSLDEGIESGKRYSKQPRLLLTYFDFPKLVDMDLFEAFIKDMQKNNIKVIFFLPPYQPYVYSVIRKDPFYNKVFAAEKYYVNFAKRNKIKIYGAYNPAKLNLSEKDFYDGIHLKENIVKRLNILNN